jgi:hypothetical protein
MPHARNYHGSMVAKAMLRFAPVILLCAFAAEAVHAGEYLVSVEPELSTLHVNACFDPPLREGVSAGSGDAAAYLRDVRADGREAPVPRRNSRWLDLGAESTCIEYAVDARTAAGARRFPNVNSLASGSMLLDPDDWLWLPAGIAQVHFLRFELPADMEVSAPWPSAGTRRFRIDVDAREESALVALGRMRTAGIALPGSELRLATLTGSPPVDPVLVRHWIQNGAEAIATVYGSFPVSSPQVLVVPIGRGGEPVPWGQVQRGGGPAAHLFIDQTRPAAEFESDWVLVHELAHFLHPGLETGSAWLSEGLATYYQYVSRARAGMLTEQEAWQKLHEGFERGKAQTRDGVDLIEASRSMRAQRTFMRVYWTGAAVALLADIALRDAGSSLDEALRHFRNCCLEEPRDWETGEFLERLDRLTGTEVMSDLGRRYLHSDQFPPLEDAYNRVGLRATGGQIELEPASGASELRRAIMGARR